MAAGYDYATNVISSEGKVYQLEYAAKAVESSGTTVGVQCKDGVILASEKLMMSKMLVDSTCKVVHKVDDQIGVAYSGIGPDGKSIVGLAQNIAHKYKQNYGERIAPGVLAQQLGDILYAYTSYAAYRPFGAHALVCGYDEDHKESQLYLCELDGTVTRYWGTAVGKGARSARTEIQKLKLTEKTCAEALPLLAKILHTVHDPSKDKPFVLEAGWATDATKGTFSRVPKDVLAAADAEGKAASEADGAAHGGAAAAAAGDA